MKLNVKAMAITFSLLWGGGILVVGLANLAWTGYGQAFLEMMASVYPGYHGTNSLGQVVVGTLYGLLDGGICGALLAWLYNRLSG